MGNRFEVTAWVPYNPADVSVGYHDQTMWRGESLIAALFNLWKCKRAGHGCVSLHVR
ncbi:MAG: hypothetical protein K0R43_1672 [Pseudoduganella sp.]|jgi:hypothetical protein|nr:hypothetical protein [Pseudoduganella sp.]